MTLDASLQSSDPHDEFERTTCACQSCTVACLHMPGGLIPGDVERIAEHAGAEDVEAWALENLAASDGAVIHGEQDYRFPTIVPQSRPDGSCVFLTDDLCTIHEVSPYGCSHLDTHQSPEESKQRSDAGLRPVVADWAEKGPYSQLWHSLKESGRDAPPLQTRRANFQAAFHAIQQQQQVQAKRERDQHVRTKAKRKAKAAAKSRKRNRK